MDAFSNPVALPCKVVVRLGDFVIIRNLYTRMEENESFTFEFINDYTIESTALTAKSNTKKVHSMLLPSCLKTLVADILADQYVF